ncbi:MAG: hypothetical protein FWC28_04310 [Proteobacteria bacterium]|nr:hypothetical protein [Cystobacterineae bacterium]MCL2259223.1 hypothetical protein [Cystobacterineae bacterium]MCL2314459.1 hypothetical protein [Pseudomonadota bacterium]
MRRSVVYAVGILAWVLGTGCVKRAPTPSIADEQIADLAAWVPREMEGVIMVSSLEELKAFVERLKLRSSWEPLREGLEELQAEGKEQSELDLFALSTWQEMGIHLKAPLMVAMNIRKEAALFALPLVDEALLLAAIEKHLVAKGKWEAQSDMPQGLRAWKFNSGDFFMLAQKPGYALIYIGDNLEALQKVAALSAEDSWAKHKGMMLGIGSRLPVERVISLWARLDEKMETEVDWIGGAIGAQPRLKVAVDITWRPGREPWLPAMQTAPFQPKQWPTGLGSAALEMWYSVTWDWYAELLKRHAVGAISQMIGFVAEEKLDEMKQHFESPMWMRGWTQEAQEEGDSEKFCWSLDLLLKEGSDIEKSLKVLASLIPAKEVKPTPAGAKIQGWQAQFRGQEVLAQAIGGEGKVRVTNSAGEAKCEAPSALQKAVAQEMKKFPVALAVHLNALAKARGVRAFLELGQLKKTEYVLFGLQANEGHAQFVAEHFVETDYK